MVNMVTFQVNWSISVCGLKILCNLCQFPVSASRAKLSMINTMSKIRGQEKGPGYPQAEALLADAMLKFGRELGEECNFGNLITSLSIWYFSFHYTRIKMITKFSVIFIIKVLWFYKGRNYARNSCSAPSDFRLVYVCWYYVDPVSSVDLD